ncbi:hypothetical protein [Rhizobium mongolense]|uniref:hypothetical protein n=1 Tax=Rhizobium mongolense TaxID=57676 RepID=UPI0035585AF0
MSPVSASIIPPTGISNFEDLDAWPDREAPVTTMFSGRLDITYLLYMLQRLGFAKIKAVTVNVGMSIDKPSLEETAARSARALSISKDGKFLSNKA